MTYGEPAATRAPSSSRLSLTCLIVGLTPIARAARPFYQAPILAGGVLYLTTTTSNVALDAASGTVVWGPAGDNGLLSLSDGVLYTVDFGHHVTEWGLPG